MQVYVEGQPERGYALVRRRPSVAFRVLLPES